MLIRKKASLIAMGLTLACVLVGPARAAFPEKPITLVVPFSPGGANDAVARVVATAAEPLLGVTVVVVNKPGAGGTIGSEEVARASPDGYTLLLTSAAHAINSLVYPDLKYDPVKDFAPVSQLTEAPYVAVVNKDLAVHSLKGLLDMARKSPGRYTYASSGNGSAPHLAAALMADMAGVTMRHIPYKGGGPALVGLMRGDVQLYFSSITSALGPVHAGRVRALAVSTPTRSDALPDVPTVAEAGLPGYELTGWYGILAPANTPKGVIRKLNSAFVQALKSPTVEKQLRTQGEKPIGSTPEGMMKRIKHDVKAYRDMGRLIKVD